MNDDTISRQVAIANAISGRTREIDGEKWIRVSEVRESIKTLPPAERHGRWIFSPDHAEGICTSCHYKIYGRPYQNTYMIVPYNYCPNCGSRMDL